MINAGTLRALVVAHLGVAIDVEIDGTGEQRRVFIKRNTGVVVGDTVLLTGNHIDIEERRSTLMRRSPGGGIHLVAANISYVGIVTAVDPPAKYGLLDRAAIAARAAGMQPMLIVNKTDLPGANDVVTHARARAGGAMPVFAVSATSGDGMAELMAALASVPLSALVGPSGVGKSSLLNRLVPQADLRTSTLSTATGAGRHTTTGATLHHLPTGGALIDTPGVREFGLVDVTTAQLAQYFVGFEGHVDGCHFGNCLHQAEPGCGVLAALAAHAISDERYAAYRALLDENTASEARLQRTSGHGSNKMRGGPKHGRPKHR